MGQSRQFQKRVELSSVDVDEQLAVGGVLVPDKLDRQGDFIRPEVIRSMADDFMRRLQSTDGDEPTPSGGIMHAAFPDFDDVYLVLNEVLDEEREVGGKTFPAGSWIQGWKVDDDDLWQLVDDGVLDAYSIGGSEVEWNEYEQKSTVPGDIDVPEDYPDDASVWEIIAGRIDEVSFVDVPAVPDAVITVAKASGADPRNRRELMKAATQLIESKESCATYLTEERGHDEGDAERVCSLIQRHADGDEKRAAAIVSKALTHTPNDDTTMSDPDKSGEGLFETVKGILGSSDEDEDPEKAGRSLNRRNRDAAMAAHDALEDLLSSDLDFRGNRFTEDPTTDFTIGEYGKSAPNPEGSSGENTDADASKSDDDGEATDDDTTDDTTTMSDDENIKSLVESVAKATERNAEAIETLAKTREDNDEDYDDDGEGEGDGTGGNDNQDGDEDKFDTEQALKDLADSVESNAENIEELAKAQGVSHQVGGTPSNKSEGDTDDAWRKTFGLPGGDN